MPHNVYGSRSICTVPSHSCFCDAGLVYITETAQGSDELALCYYRNISDPEVRSWIYLKDMIEIAEDKDTMIFSSAARTLHLYAETRAEHNLWVTSLAELCPDAFVKLEREFC